MALLLLGLLALLGLWGLLCACTHTPSTAPRWPPGPRPLPLVGNLHLLRVSQQDRSLMEVGQSRHVLRHRSCCWAKPALSAHLRCPGPHASEPLWGRSFVASLARAWQGTHVAGHYPALGKRKMPHPPGKQMGHLRSMGQEWHAWRALWTRQHLARACRRARFRGSKGKKAVLLGVCLPGRPFWRPDGSNPMLRAGRPDLKPGDGWPRGGVGVQDWPPL